MASAMSLRSSLEPFVDRNNLGFVAEEIGEGSTDITEDTVRELALPLGLVDVKACAIDEVWSGLKLVIRKELR